MKAILTAYAILACLAGVLAQNPAADKKQLAACEAAYAKTKASFLKHPHDKKAKEAYVVATDRYATASMTTTVLPPKVRYPQSLRLYREVLKVEPTNKEASNNAAMIESVYRSMHRPIPK